MSTHLDNRDRYERITGDRTAPWHPEWLLPDHYPTDTRLPFDVAMFRARHVAEPRITEEPSMSNRDMDAIASDWEAVGDDLRTAMTDFEHGLHDGFPPPRLPLHRRVDWWHVLGRALCLLSAVLVIVGSIYVVAIALQRTVP